MAVVLAADHQRYRQETVIRNVRARAPEVYCRTLALQRGIAGENSQKTGHTIE